MFTLITLKLRSVFTALFAKKKPEITTAVTGVLYCPPPACTVDICCGPTVIREEAPLFVRMDCGNVDFSWKPPAPLPANRAQRRDRNFGATTDRNGDPLRTPPSYVAMQPKRLDRVR